VIERLAETLEISVRKEKFQAIFGRGQVDNEKVLLVKPQTFMNLSGESIRPFMEYWKIKGEDLLVLHDDLDFSLGAIRLVFDAGAAGHRGVESIIEEIGTKSFYRLRLGIGRSEYGDSVDYVLSRFKEEQEEEAKRLIERAVLAVRVWVMEGPEMVQRKFHQKEC
jgi:PTH1 family peptidyl-tRNA hydrolase